MLTRRQLLERAASLGAGAPALGVAPLAWPAAGGQGLVPPAPRARYWASGADAGKDCLRCHPAGEVLKAGHHHRAAAVKCLLCAQGCTIPPGGRGACRARANVGGELKSLVYGRPLSIRVDPIEKKPFYHFLPGSDAFSFGTSGCPLRCRFCQNWELSQSSPGDFSPAYRTPADLARAASLRRSPIVAFTYNEPTVFTEYMLDVAAESRQRGIRSVMVSCGLMNEAPLADLCAALSAIKIDLKGFSEPFYRDVCGAELRPVLRSIRQIAATKVHLEIVNLVVPSLNDSDRALRDLVSFVAGELGPDVPLHFSRFYPDYQLLHLPPTPVSTLERARDLGMAAGLHYVYIGNIPGHAGNHTYCPACRKVVVRREGFFVTGQHLVAGRCEYCRARVKGVWA